MTLAEIEAELATLGCGDNSCSVVQRGGMGTNSGCHCIMPHMGPREMSRLRRALTLRRVQVDMLMNKLHDAGCDVGLRGEAMSERDTLVAEIRARWAPDLDGAAHSRTVPRAREDIAWLLAEVERLRAERDEAATAPDGLAAIFGTLFEFVLDYSGGTPSKRDPEEWLSECRIPANAVRDRLRSLAEQYPFEWREMGLHPDQLRWLGLRQETTR